MIDTNKKIPNYILNAIKYTIEKFSKTNTVKNISNTELDKALKENIEWCQPLELKGNKDLN